VVEPDLVTAGGKVGDGVHVAGGVQGRFEHEAVCAGPAGEHVVAATTVEPVVLSAAIESVVAAFGNENVVAVSTAQDVIPVTPAEMGVAGETFDEVVVDGAPESIVACSAFLNSYI
jgi:hypothetical protein